jgi:nicotinamide N-methyltransferase
MNLPSTRRPQSETSPAGRACECALIIAQGHLLWQGGRTVADYLESNRDRYVQDRTVLELGAGAGLPSLVCAINGAKYVLVTDYPDADLIENLSKNIQDCAWVPNPPNIEAEGYLWGADVSNLNRRASASGADAGFDLLILADLLFNHSEHERLLATVQRTLKRVSEAQALVFFTPYRPWLFEKDLAFFEIAKSGGFVVEKVLEKVMDKVMFDEDRGVSRSAIGFPRRDLSLLIHTSRTSSSGARFSAIGCAGRQRVLGRVRDHCLDKCDA